MSLTIRNLTIDPQLDSDYLADSMINGMPNTMQAIGKIRGQITGLLASGKTPREWTQEDIQELQALYTELTVRRMTI